MTPPRTIYLETMGCQMNALDSELVLGELLARNYRPTDDAAGASLVVLNTCSVREHAEEKVYSRLGQLKRSRRNNPEQIVAVIGCMAERDGDGLIEKMPHVDILCGPSELHRLASLIDDVNTHRSRAIALSGRLRNHTTPQTRTGGHEDLESLDSGRAFGLSSHAATPRIFGQHQAYVRITRGCNKYCTFCVVPYTRGPEVHRPADQIVDEVRRLADAGVMEVTLLGQTVNHYEFRPEGGGAATSFADLLRRVHDEVPHLPRLRFVTSFPRDFTDEALEVMAQSPRICRYLHIPAQSGSNSVLRRMNRGYTVEEYRGLLDRARVLMPDLAIAGTCCRLCGETEEIFKRASSCCVMRDTRTVTSSNTRRDQARRRTRGSPTTCRTRSSAGGIMIFLRSRLRSVWPTIARCSNRRSKSSSRASASARSRRRSLNSPAATRSASHGRPWATRRPDARRPDRGVRRRGTHRRRSA